MWRDQFDWVYREMDYAVFPDRDPSRRLGRPQVLLMLERLYAHMVAHPGVRFITLARWPTISRAASRSRDSPMCGLWRHARRRPPLARCGTLDRAALRRERMLRPCDRARVLAPRASQSTTSRVRASCCAPRPARPRSSTTCSNLWGRAEKLGKRRIDPARIARMIPLHMLTGFLGSGKTTLLNRILRDPAWADSAG
jgi:hypothetical protein